MARRGNLTTNDDAVCMERPAENEWGNAGDFRRLRVIWRQRICMPLRNLNVLRARLRKQAARMLPYEEYCRYGGAPGAMGNDAGAMAASPIGVRHLARQAAEALKWAIVIGGEDKATRRRARLVAKMKSLSTHAIAVGRRLLVVGVEKKVNGTS